MLSIDGQKTRGNPDQVGTTRFPPKDKTHDLIDGLNFLFQKSLATKLRNLEVPFLFVRRQIPAADLGVESCVVTCSPR